MKNLSVNSRPSIEHRLAQGISWGVAGAVVSSGLTFCATFSVARILGQNGFGELSVIQSTVGMFSTAAGFGFGIATTKYVAEFRDRFPERALRIVLLSLLLSLVTGGLTTAVVLAIAPWLTGTMLAAGHLVVTLRIGSLLLFIGAVDGVLLATLAGFEQFRSITIASLAKGLCAFPCLVAGAFLGGPTGAVWGLVAAATVGVCFSALLTAIHLGPDRSRIKTALASCFREWKVVSRFALPVFAATGVFAAGKWISHAILANQTNGYAELGLLTAANRFFAALLVVFSLINKPLIPVLSEQEGLAKRTGIAQVLRLAMQMNAIVILPLALLCALLSPWAMSTFGAEFARGWPTLVVVLFTVSIIAVLGPIGHWIVATGRPWVHALQFAVWSLVLVGLTYWFIPWGARGVATARAGAYSVYATLVVSYAMRHASVADRPKVRLSRPGAAEHVLVGARHSA